MDVASYELKSDYWRRRKQAEADALAEAVAKAEALGRAEGEARGRAEGEARGRAEALAEGEARAVLAVLAARGIDVPDDAHQRITACTDLDQLETWVRRSVTANSTDDLFR